MVTAAIIPLSKHCQMKDDFFKSLIDHFHDIELIGNFENDCLLNVTVTKALSGSGLRLVEEHVRREDKETVMVFLSEGDCQQLRRIDKALLSEGRWFIPLICADVLGKLKLNSKVYFYGVEKETVIVSEQYYIQG